ncbi:MAG TPA: ABC transporter substrate-binding protein, partial [Clostridia bacterium]|nr:ABC transporter substrate-binding protein [Clostridia bacterium]
MFLRKALGILTVVALVLGFSFFAGCSQEQEPGGETVYKIGDTRGDWGFPAPYLHYQRGPGYVRLSYIFDTLVWKDDTGFIPALAESWEYLEADNAYVFDLQKNVSWHDGEPFSAGDVGFTFKYIKEHPYLLVDDTIVDKVDVLDDYRVKLTLKEPYSPFLSNIAATMPILPEHIYKDIDDPEGFTDIKAATGTGPYKFADYKKEMGTYLYTANEDYYLGKPTFDKIMFVKINENMAASALEKQEVDAIVIKPEMKDTLAESGFNFAKGTYDMT